MRIHVGLSSARHLRLPGLTRRIGHRGAFLTFLAFLDLVYGWFLAFPPPAARQTPLYVYLASILPLDGWAALWTVVGLVCLVHVFLARDVPAFAAAAMLKVAWGIVAVAAWASGKVPQGYLSGAIWLAFAGVVLIIADWPEPAREA